MGKCILIWYMIHFTRNKKLAKESRDKKNRCALFMCYAESTTMNTKLNRNCCSDCTNTYLRHKRLWQARMGMLPMLYNRHHHNIIVSIGGLWDSSISYQMWECVRFWRLFVTNSCCFAWCGVFIFMSMQRKKKARTEESIKRAWIVTGTKIRNNMLFCIEASPLTPSNVLYMWAKRIHNLIIWPCFMIPIRFFSYLTVVLRCYDE